MGWDPDLLDHRLKQLGDVAVKVPWNIERQKQYQERMNLLKGIEFDANEAIPLKMTRMVIAQDQSIKLSSIATHITVVAAYQSKNDIKADFILHKNPEIYSNLGFLIGQKIAIPRNRNPERSLKKAIKLAKKSDFKLHRKELYEWQDDIIKKGIAEENALRELDEMIVNYNDCVKKAVKKVYYKFAFTIGGIAIGLVGGMFAPIATAGAFLSIVQFATLDRKPVIEGSENKAAAMFHDIKKALGWSVK